MISNAEEMIGSDNGVLSGARGAGLWRQRFARGLARQGALILGFAALGAAVDFALYYLQLADPSAPTGLWTGVGLGFGVLVALVREGARDTVNVGDFGVRLPFKLVSAAPEVSPRGLRQLPPDKRTPLGFVSHSPASRFASAMRELQSQLLDDQVVAFVGAAPDEGATTTALCAAASAAQQGRRVVIVDCDLRRRALTKLMGGDVEIGVLELASDPTRWRDAVCEDEDAGFHYIPAARQGSAWRTLAGAPGFRDLINQLRGSYDLVFLDCPPALVSADSIVVAAGADHAIVVAAWDRTPTHAVRRVAAALRRLGSTRLPGVCLNLLPIER